MLFPAAWTNMHNHPPRDWGKCTRLAHPCRCIRTRSLRNRFNEHVTLLQEHQRLILSTIDFGTVMDRLPRIFSYSGHRHKRQDKPPIFLFLLLCLPVASRRTTAFGLSEPRGPHLSGLAQTSPSLSPPSAWTIVLFHCFFWPPFLHFCPRDISAARLPPVATQNPDLQSQYTIRLRLANPDEPFGPSHWLLRPSRCGGCNCLSASGAVRQQFCEPRLARIGLELGASWLRDEVQVCGIPFLPKLSNFHLLLPFDSWSF